MSNNGMVFKYEEMKGVMSEIETEFANLASLLDQASDLILEEAFVTPDSAVFGEVGNQLLNIWDKNDSKFGNFKSNFESWANTMVTLHSRNSSFNDEAVAAFKANATTGLSMDGVQEAREFAALSAGYTQVGYKNGDSVGFSTLDGYSKSGTHRYDIGDNSYLEYTTDENGKMLSLSTYENGELKDKKEFSPITGVVSSVIRYTEGKAQKIICDSDGTVLSTIDYDGTNTDVNPNKIEFYGDNGKKFIAVESLGSYILKDSSGKDIMYGVSYDKISPYLQNNSAVDVVLKSGDYVNINGANYNVYGFVQTADGIVTMYADDKDMLYYLDDHNTLQSVTEIYTTYDGPLGSAQSHSSNATINSIDATHTFVRTNMDISGYGVSMPENAYSSIQIGDTVVDSSSSVLGTVAFTNGALNSSVKLIDSDSVSVPYSGINHANETTTDGRGISSYQDEFSNVVSGTSVVKATSMDSFAVPNDQKGTRVVVIPKNQEVQWDSPSGGTGYTFDTSSSDVYLKWIPGVDGNQGGYQIVDEFGNAVSDRIFGLDGFNNNGGANGGVWG